MAYVTGYESLPATGTSIIYEDLEAPFVQKRFYGLKVWLSP